MRSVRDIIRLYSQSEQIESICNSKLRFVQFRFYNAEGVGWIYKRSLKLYLSVALQSSQIGLVLPIDRHVNYKLIRIYS